MRIRFFVAILIAATGFGSTPAIAQSGLDGRVGRLESQMRAVQRKVFPGGAGQYFEPQITAPETTTGPGPGVPATSPVNDLTVRVNALESQLRTMTGQIEEDQHRLQQLENDFTAYKRATDARLNAGASGALPGDEVSPPVLGSSPPADSGGTLRPPAGSGGGTLQLPASQGGPDRAARLATVEKPSTGDGADDGYVYGYRLWSAKFYPEAEAQLKSVVAKYPEHRRASWAQNLLGRAYLDEGKPSLASIAFYDNYKKMPDGERAPDSLYYLAQALMQLKKPADACKVYGELSDVYAGKISASMKADTAHGRATAGCK